MHPARRSVVLAALLDVVLVVVFATIGRASHDRGVFGDNGLGPLETAWPFLVALVVGWLVAVAWRRPSALWPTGVLVWIVTVVGGMLLRFLSGQGTALAFVIVAAITLALFLLGWRAIAGFLARRRSP